MPWPRKARPAASQTVTPAHPWRGASQARGCARPAQSRPRGRDDEGEKAA